MSRHGALLQRELDVGRVSGAGQQGGGGLRRALLLPTLLSGNLALLVEKLQLPKKLGTTSWNCK